MGTFLLLAFFISNVKKITPVTGVVLYNSGVGCTVIEELGKN